MILHRQHAADAATRQAFITVTMELPRPYSEWRTDPEGRWRDAFHTFGHLLLSHARDNVVNDAPQEQKDIASRAATDALYNLMMILEGVAGFPSVDGRTLEFALVARVRDTSTDAIMEEFELAPNGDEPACMGFHIWTEGEFRE